MITLQQIFRKFSPQNKRSFLKPSLTKYFSDSNRELNICKKIVYLIVGFYNKSSCVPSAFSNSFQAIFLIVMPCHVPCSEAGQLRFLSDKRLQMSLLFCLWEGKQT